MTFAKRHFEFIADAIQSALPSYHDEGDSEDDINTDEDNSYQAGFEAGAESACSILVHKLADLFQQDNKRFNRKLFLEQCGFADVED
jgi:hypothetical protein